MSCVLPYIQNHYPTIGDNFQQKEKETIGAAWDIFSILMRYSPDLFIPNHVLLQHFWLGLSKESALQLDIAARGSFTHKTTVEGEALLDLILENTPRLEPLCVELELNHEEVSLAKAEPIASLERPLPELEDPKEGFQPLDLLYFEDEFFEDFRNTSKYSCQKRPLVLVTPCDPIDKEFLKESIKELIAIMSGEWVEEAELSFEEIHIHTPSRPFKAKLVDLGKRCYTTLW
jgi:hypothetical protein